MLSRRGAMHGWVSSLLPFHLFGKYLRAAFISGGIRRSMVRSYREYSRLESQTSLVSRLLKCRARKKWRKVRGGRPGILNRTKNYYAMWIPPEEIPISLLGPLLDVVHKLYSRVLRIIIITIIYFNWIFMSAENGIDNIDLIIIFERISVNQIWCLMRWIAFIGLILLTHFKRIIRYRDTARNFEVLNPSNYLTRARSSLRSKKKLMRRMANTWTEILHVLWKFAAEYRAL